MKEQTDCDHDLERPMTEGEAEIARGLDEFFDAFDMKKKSNHQRPDVSGIKNSKIDVNQFKKTMVLERPKKKRNYRLIGRKGGLETLKRHGKEHFKKLRRIVKT